MMKMKVRCSEKCFLERFMTFDGSAAGSAGDVG
jgi:hypothetical protein